MPILTPQERLGTKLAGKYRLEQVLGRGGMGVVYAGVHEWTGRPVAIKLLRDEYAEDVGVVKRFLSEAKAAAGLKHPCVIDVLDMGRDDAGPVYLVLELLDGCALSDYLDAKGALDAAEALDILLPIMDALCEAHRGGIIHRDLKPDNVFLSRDPDGMLAPKLLDFGIAKFLEAQSVATRTGTIVGTPHYMSPEQASSSRDIGPNSDVWSIAVVLVECLRGERVFDGVSIMEVLVAIMTGPLPDLDVIADLPPAVARVIEPALERDPSERTPSMEAFAAGLRAAAGEAGLTLDTPRALEATGSGLDGPGSGVRMATSAEVGIDPAADTATPHDPTVPAEAPSADGAHARPTTVDPTAATSESFDSAEPATGAEAETPTRGRAPWALGALLAVGVVGAAVSLGTREPEPQRTFDEAPAGVVRDPTPLPATEAEDRTALPLGAALPPPELAPEEGGEDEVDPDAGAAEAALAPEEATPAARRRRTVRGRRSPSPRAAPSPGSAEPAQPSSAMAAAGGVTMSGVTMSGATMSGVLPVTEEF